MNKNNYLIDGEIFIYKNKSEKSQNIFSDEEINEKYKKGEIRIVTEQARYPLNSISTMLKTKNYNLNPEYQRRKRWNNTKKSRLIESFIMNVPIPPIFLYEVDFSFYEVMDGLQRLTAIDDFYNDIFRLEGLEYWQELNDKKYSELPDQIQKAIDRRYLSSIVLLKETAKNKAEAENLKQIVFERLNSGGEKLTPQETRNALYNGKFNRVCLKLAKKDLFRKMWFLPLEEGIDEFLLNNSTKNISLERYRKMEDVELVLRFFAFRHINQLKGSSIIKFLDQYLNEANNFTETVIFELTKIFEETIDLLYFILGEEAFLLPKTAKDRTPKLLIYDPIMQAFAMNLENMFKLKENANLIKENLYKNTNLLYNEKNDYLFDSKYDNIQERINYFNTYLQQYI